MDLLTLYLISIGTLLASAGLTFWDAHAHVERRQPLRLLASGYAILALGCAGVLYRHSLPGALGSALSNLVILTGYLMIFNGVAALDGRRHYRFSAGLLVVMALLWMAAGERWLTPMWAYVTSVPIALISGLTAWEMLRSSTTRSLPARRIVVAVAAIHALTYTLRALVLPWLVALYGTDIQALAGKLTLYEGALYSVVLPMTLLKLIREESHGRLLRESQTDYLTRLGNRRWFFEEGGRALQAGGGQEPIAILAFDLDHFKTINDRYGHQTGDEVLRSFAEITRAVLGQDAILARIGGEEFVALLQGEDARRAAPLGAAVARRFADTIMSRVNGLGRPATVSVGLAQFDEAPADLTEGLAQADRALYCAKALGGNRLEMAKRLQAVAA